jgi:hypothetical protein
MIIVGVGSLAHHYIDVAMTSVVVVGLMRAKLISEKINYKKFRQTKST